MVNTLENTLWNRPFLKVSFECQATANAEYQASSYSNVEFC